MTGGAAARSPRVVGRYALYEPLGKGGAASVFLSVERRETPVVVAVKLLHASQARDAAAVSRLLDEVRLSRLVRHENVVRVRDFVSDGTEMLSVMDYVHGEPLSRLLVATGARAKVPPPIAAAIVVDVLSGLHAAHEARDAEGAPLRIVHRDVTPENVLVGDDGAARITDFGVAKAEGRLQETRDGGVRGKLMYLAPEQIGGDVSPKTDVYAAGLVLWEMLVGARAIEGGTEAELVTRALDPKIPRPSARGVDLPRALDDVVTRAIDRDPEARFPSAAAMAEALVATGEIASRAQVAAWVASVAGPVLEARSAVVAAMLDAERAAELPTTVDAAAAAPPPGRGGESDSRRLLTWLAIGLAMALAGGGIAIAWRTPSAIEARDAGVGARATATVTPAGGALVVEASVPVEAASSTVDGSTSPPVSSESTAPDPSTRGKPPHGGKGAPSPKCDPPWLIDAQGIRRYNPACIR
ncbi:MAG: serine/threonine protein kinase [Deltaproteobacteria bacterium]|nr:serine/threonine protein kinase [Deltaproteobacteria bacterium]